MSEIVYFAIMLDFVRANTINTFLATATDENWLQKGSVFIPVEVFHLCTRPAWCQRW